MSNDRIPPNPYPVKPPPNMPAPRKESLEAENARLKAEVERLIKAALQVHQELDEFGQVSAKSVHELRDAAKGGQP